MPTATMAFCRHVFASFLACALIVLPPVPAASCRCERVMSRVGVLPCGGSGSGCCYSSQVSSKLIPTERVRVRCPLYFSFYPRGLDVFSAPHFFWCWRFHFDCSYLQISQHRLV